MKRGLVALAVVVVTCLVAAVAFASGALRPALNTTVEGDAELAAQVQPLVTGASDRLSVCVATGSETTTASFGADDRTPYQIASLSKTFTGELFALALAFGEVREDTVLGDLLPELSSAPVGEVTLFELGTHTSGLGEWGDDGRDGQLMHEFFEQVRADNAHDATMAELYDRAASDPLATRGSYSYSNIGISLLGYALAAAAGTDFSELVSERILRPWQLDDTSSGMEAPPNPPAGYTELGLQVPAWDVGAYGPSGGIISTIGDMCEYAQQVMLFEEAFPGADSALDPRELANGAVAGFGWTHRQVGDDIVAFKSGTTAGFSATIAIGDQVAVVALSNTATPVDELVQELMERRL